MIFRIIQFFMCIGAGVAVVLYVPLIFASFVWIKIAILTSRIKHRSIIAPISGINLFFAPDKLFFKPTATLIHLAILESTPGQLEKTVIGHLQKIYDTTDSNQIQSRKYAKLGYSLDYWCGYLFWKKLEDFRISNQIKFIYNMKLDHSSVSAFVEGIIREPFEKNRALWNIYVVTQCSPSSTQEQLFKSPCFIIFRTHHLLLDGMSLVKLWHALDTLSDSPASEGLPLPPPPPKIIYNASLPVPKKRGRLSELARNLFIVLVQTPFLAHKYVCCTEDINCLTSHTDYDQPWYTSGVNKIHLEEYRGALRSVGYSITHVLLVGYIRGLKRFIQENYGAEKVPEKIHIMGSVPIAYREADEALTNHWAIMRYKAKLLPSNDFKEELECAKTEYKRAVNHVIPKSFDLSHNSFGMRHVPIWAYDLLCDSKKCGTLSISNVPGPAGEQRMFGVKVEDRAMWLPLTRNNSGIGLLLLTYNGWGTFSITADSNCIKSRELFLNLNETVMEEMKYVLEEVKELAKNKNDVNANVVNSSIILDIEGCED